MGQVVNGLEQVTHLGSAFRHRLTPKPAVALAVAPGGCRRCRAASCWPRSGGPTARSATEKRGVGPGPEVFRSLTPGCANGGGGTLSWLWVKTIWHFGAGAPPILVYFSGGWDVHWGYGLSTHGRLNSGVSCVLQGVAFTKGSPTRVSWRRPCLNGLGVGRIGSLEPLWDL